MTKNISSASDEMSTQLLSTCPMPEQAKNCLSCTLRKTGWFCDLSPRSMLEYDAMDSHIALPAGGILFSQGDEPQGVFVICAGRMKLTCSSREGKTLLVRIAKPGDVLGLSAALANGRYEVTAQSIEVSQIKLFPESDFLHFIKHRPDGGLHAAESLNHEYHSALNDACRLAPSNSIVGRVAHLLLDLATSDGTALNAQPKIYLPLTHEEVASMLGSSRESITRVLSSFRRMGIISVKTTTVAILRKEALEILL